MINRENYFTEEQIQERIARFESLLLSVDRPGMDKLLDFIRKTDFYTAPASTRFHNAVKGGLLDHSLNVYDCLARKIDVEQICAWPDDRNRITLNKDSIILTGLLHDLCKVNFYEKTTRNVRHYEPEIVQQEIQNGAYAKSDAMGQFVWVTEVGYKVNDTIPYGHGEKSVMMIEEFVKLTMTERYMIRWHMGFSNSDHEWPALSAAMEKKPQVIAIVEADLEASHLLDVRES